MSLFLIEQVMIAVVAREAAQMSEAEPSATGGRSVAAAILTALVVPAAMLALAGRGLLVSVRRQSAARGDQPLMPIAVRCRRTSRPICVM